MATHKDALADRNRVRPAKLTRRLGILALGSLLGNGPPSLLAADGSPASTRDRPGIPSAEAPTTATSSLALLHPARTFTVSTAADVVDSGDGKLSLREAVDLANATAALDAIRFAASLEGMTLVLTGGQLPISEDLSIDGDHDDNGSRVSIDGNRNGRIFEITGAGTDVALASLGLSDGNGYNGGSIRHLGRSLAIADSDVDGYCYRGSDDYTGCFGGAVHVGSGSELTVTGSRITGRGGWGGGVFSAGEVVIRDSVFKNGRAKGGGAIFLREGTASIYRSAIADNGAALGGGILVGGFGDRGHLTLNNSTVADNEVFFSIHGYGNYGGGIHVSSGNAAIINTTITGNNADRNYGGFGGGISSETGGRLEISNSIVAGNGLRPSDGRLPDPDISGTITRSNGHNVFGSDVAGSVPGDRRNVPPRAVFAAVDPETGGGKLSVNGIVPLKRSLANPALSAADPLAAAATGQLGITPRPRPATSLPDVGAVEIDQPLSTGATLNNDVIAGSAAANVLRGLAGNDLIRALRGNDTVDGDAGSDLLDGGLGNNRLDGGSGVDLVTFAFSAVPVVVDLAAGIARRGRETDRLTSIEGAIGTAKADRFTGNEHDNWFQGGLGRDLATGGGGRDIYDFDRVQESPPGSARRDMIGDFAPNQDVLDLTRIDADPTLPGNQAFRWVGTAPLTGVGQLGYVLSGGSTLVRASTDGDHAPELEIQLTGRRMLTEADVRL